MRVFNINSVPTEHCDDPDFLSELKTFRLGEAAGSERLYVNIDFVKPGAQSAKYHAHERQEEFFLILGVSGILRINDQEIEVKPGDFIAKVAGRGIAHQFINNGTEILQILDCGTREPIDIITYPDEDVVYIRKEKLVFKKSDALKIWSS